MFVSCPAARFHALSVPMCMPTCTRYVCGSAGTFTLSLSRQRALPRTVCMRQRGHFTLPLSRQRGHFQSFTHYMHAAARALSLFHSSTLKAARRHLGMSVCRRRRSAGLQRVEFVGLLGFAFESVVRVLWSCGPAGVVCAVMLSAMHAHDLARLRTTC